MKKNHCKFISNIFIVSVFLFFSCGKSGKREITKDYFCSKVFSMPSTVEPIDMKINRVTTLNCDGTYTSKEDWGTSPKNEEIYRTTTGSSSGTNTNFSGVWEVVDNKKLPEEIDNWLKKYSREADFYNEKLFTVLKYKSSTGVSGYLCITGYQLKGQISLSHITTSSTTHLGEDELNFYGGFLVK